MRVTFTKCIYEDYEVDIPYKEFVEDSSESEHEAVLQYMFNANKINEEVEIDNIEIGKLVGYQGLLKLAHNTGQFKRITAKEVHDNDEFSIDYGTGEIVHKPVIRGESGEVIGYYAVYETKEGGRDSFYMSKEDAENYGHKFSKSYSSGPWTSNFDSMAKKSCIIQVLKYAPKAIDKPELGQAMAFDNQVFRASDFDKETGGITYDIDYEVVSEEEKAKDPKTLQVSDDDSKNKKVDKDTGEILEDDFFSDDFVPVSENE